MSFLLTCPVCGPREVTDFRYGGELVARPAGAPGRRELGAYNYFRKNAAGLQREWWFHRFGCRTWFVAERDTRTNEVRSTALPGPGDDPGQPGGGGKVVGAADAAAAQGGLH